MTSNEHPDANRIKSRILTENTAQAVLKHLKANQSKRRRMVARWVWELLQNARDTSGTTRGGLVASIAHEDGNLVFEHTGRPFTMFEVGHLIFHGSTKTEDEGTIGQYGSGFLTTHLISPDVEVSGRLDDDRPFRFTMRRADGSVQELSEAMDRAWLEFNDSLTKAETSTEFTTRIRYPVAEESTEAVEIGLETLKHCAPFVIVFNPEFSMIEIRVASVSTTFRRVAAKQLSDEKGVSLITVQGSTDGKEVQVDYVLKNGEQAAVAAPLEHAGNDRTCAPPSGVPRLFLGFPLVGTDEFSFPLIINSLDFTPTEDRDGVFLGEGRDEANRRNQAIVEEACGLTSDLVCYAAASGWRNAFEWACLPETRSYEWLDSEWLHGVLMDHFVTDVRASQAILKAEADPLLPSEARLPVAGTNAHVESLWHLLHGCKELRHLLPLPEEAFGWSRAVSSWAATDADDDRPLPSLFPEVVDGETLASEIDERTRDGEDYVTLRALQDLLHDGVAARDWLNRLHQFLKESGAGEAVRELHLVVDQSGFLDSVSALHRDCGIDAELKDIAELLNWEVRKELRDVELSALEDEEGAGDLGSDEVCERLLVKLRESASKSPTDNFAAAGARLFAWIARHGAFERLRDFPVFARDGDTEGVTVMYTPRTLSEGEPPLGPVKTWPKDLQPFADIFPPASIMAFDFFEALPDLDIWRELDGRERLVGRTVVLAKSVGLDQVFLSEPLPDGEHEALRPVEVTDVVNRADVMARVRGSRQRGLLYWRFVVRWLVEHDAAGLEIQRVDCECEQKHGVYRGAWLEPLRSGGDRWIRLEGDKRHSMGAHSLARLLKSGGEEDQARLSQPQVLRLLDAIGVSRLELMRELYSDTKEGRESLERAFVEILASAEGDVGRLSRAREYLDDLKDDEDLPEALAERRERRRVVRANRALGEHVEKLVKETLEAANFVVRRTGVGSDFEIHEGVDDVVNLRVTKGGRTWLVEVKATRDQQSVRLTTTQAKEAVKEKSRFLLCVVTVTTEAPELEEVRGSMRFVENIGDIVAPLCVDLDRLEGLRGKITTSKASGVQLEVLSGAARIRVESGIWEAGFPIGHLAERLAAH